jgi:hypothetical protein
VSIRLAPALLCVTLLATPARAQDQPALSDVPFRALSVQGVTAFSEAELRRLLRLEEGMPLSQLPAELAERLERRYAREGYVKADVSVEFDESTGTLSIRGDEGRIDAVVVEGVEPELASDLRVNLSVQPGALYNTREISRAVDRLLAPSRGAFKLSEFELVDRDGQRTLIITVRRDNYDFDLSWGTGGREDWYSPVDGLNLSTGFAASVYDHRHFNHTFLSGFVGYKFAPETVAYSFGFERPLFGGADHPRLFLSAEVHDVTASDDFWRLSVTEQSLVSVSFRNSFRDYYSARGYQVSTAFQPNGSSEVTAAWRSERHEPLANSADFSLFRDEHAFRPNVTATDGRLRAIALGVTLDSRGLDGESRRATYARHTAQRLFGHYAGADPGVRLDVTSEIAREALGGDFDFTRHVAHARTYLTLSPAQRLHARLLAGTSTGEPPAQRLFGLGGIGTVHGYGFKEAIGEGMVLANLEYHLGLPRHARLIGFLDFGRVYGPVAGTSDEWMRGIGLGLGLGDLRVDFGWRADDIPKSFQVLVRFGPTF